MDDKLLSRAGITRSKNSWVYAHPDDTRKPTLTLMHLNKMKKFKALHKIELEKREEIVASMYGSGHDDGASSDDADTTDDLF